MLGKLIKYEFKSTARVFLPLYPVLLGLALLNKLLFVVFQNSSVLTIPRILSGTLYGIMIIAISVITLIVMIMRFYKNLLGEEGYLMFTLPVKSSSLIFSKLIVAIVWCIGSIIITLLSIFIMLPDYHFLSQLPELISKTSHAFELETGMNFGLIVFEGIVFMAIATISSILMIYCSIAIGHLANRHKILVSFGAYLGIYTVVQAVNMIAITIVSVNFFDVDYVPTAANVNAIIVLSMALLAVFGAACYFVTQHILSKKLNLQ